MADIVSFKDRQSIKPATELNAELIGRLTELLDQAKTGKISWGVFAVVTTDGDHVKHGFVGYTSRHMMAAALTYVNQQISEYVCSNED